MEWISDILKQHKVQNILEVKNLTKKFTPGGWPTSRGKDFLAVDNISFHLKKGEILGFLGPNGAGKTTTLQMLLGILTPTSGKIDFFGKEFESNREEILEKVNFSSTYVNLPWNLKVRENLKFISFLYSIENRSRRLDEVRRIFRLDDVWNERLSNLSSGQLTRVNLAKAFINSPRVLLLDEPTASLDPEVAKYIHEFLLEEQKRSAISIIFTSHNMAEIEDVCDRVIFLNEGKIIADDTPQNLAASIATAHVELLINKNMEAAEKYCAQHNLSFKSDKNILHVDIAEKEIPKFLKGLVEADIAFNSIGIDKSSLKDYFLEVIHHKFEEEL